MTAPMRTVVFSISLLLTALPALADEPAPGNFAISQQRAAVMRSERIMAEATKRDGLLGQFLYMRD
ncbi:MAG: hypothetical protein ABIR16_02395, partial [Dokdonella sp.]